MKIAFLQETVNQNVGLMYLSAIVKSQGHDCQLFVESLEKDFLNAVRAFAPDVIGFSIITGAHHWVLRVATSLKRELPGVLVIAGGPHPTYCTDFIKESCIDIIARGEAEYSFPRLVECLGQGKDYSATQGLWVKRGDEIMRNDVAMLVEDLSSLPHPDHELYLKYDFYRNQSEVPFTTTRGCPFNCSFCYNHVKATLYKGKGKYVRMRGVSDIIAEMEHARRLYPKMRSVILYDDIIGIDRKWLASYCSAYRESINLPWFTSIRADIVDEGVARELGSANCFCLSLGLETGDDDLREKVLCKRIPGAQYLRAAQLLHAQNIKVRTSNMLFLPGENIEKALATININRAMEVDFAWAYTMQPYPGTDIYDYAVKSGFLPPSFQFDDIDPLGLLDPIVMVPDVRKILVVHRLFQFLIHNNVVYRMRSFLIAIGPNPVYDFFYYFSLIKSYARYHQVSFLRALKVAWTNYWGTRITRSVYVKKQKKEIHAPAASC
ncbi:MAG: radical SAM protein [Candidatus Omnitrophota bacterium]